LINEQLERLYPRHRFVEAGRLEGDGDDRQQTEVDARRDALDVDPERQPRHHHGNDARNVHLYHVEADVSLQEEHDLGTRVVSCNNRGRARRYTTVWKFGSRPNYTEPCSLMTGLHSNVKRVNVNTCIITACAVVQAVVKATSQSN